MKWHVNFFNYVLACVAIFSVAVFSSCSDDDSGPELILKANAPSFVVGEGNVTFTVTYVDKNVTAEAVITNVTSNTKVENASWTTETKGSYEFQATYDGKVSNVVSVRARTATESDAFYRYVLLTKFTAVWCGYCATAQRFLEQLDPAESEHFLIVAAHQRDRLAELDGTRLASKLNYKGWPTWNYNFASAFVGIGGSGITVQSIRTQIKNASEKYPAVCGVKAESKLEGTTAKVTATVMFQEAGNYKIACVLTENGIAQQDKEELPVFNNVFRAAQTNMMGNLIDPAVTAAGERKFNFEVTLNGSWNSQNCEFVIYVLKEESAGTFIVNNGVTCPVGGKVDYRYQDAE